MAVDACTIRDGFLPELLSKTPGSTPREAYPRHQWTLPRRDTPLGPLSGQTPAARETQEDGAKLFEFTHGELTVSEQDDPQLGARDANAPQKVQPNRTHPFLKHRRAMANCEVSPSYWGKGGRGFDIRPVCPGYAGSDECKESGADATAGGEMRDESSAAETSEVSCLRGDIRGNRPDAMTMTMTGESKLLNSALNENIALRRQLRQMEDFLQDHGLVWVGTGGPRPGCERVRESPTSSDLESIKRNIQELNGEITHEGRRRVVQTRGGAEFQETRSLHLVFYADGIVVDNGDLRAYSDHATKSFISDLRDGFFPSEFKTSDPDGLLIHAVDHRSEDSTARPGIGQKKQSTTSFSGKGRRLGGHTHRNRGHSEHLEAIGGTLRRAHHSPSSGLEVATFREDARYPEAPPPDARGDGLPPLGRYAHPSGKNHVADECHSKRAVLRVRMAPTALNMEFCMGFEDTVEDLSCLIAHRILEKLATEGSQPEQGLLRTHFGCTAADSALPADDGKNRLMNAFELRLPHSNDGTNIDLGQTIEEAGLTPKAVVIFRRRRNAQRS